MSTVIAMKDLRARLAEVADRVENGTTFTVIRRSKPSFFISPIKLQREKKMYTLNDLAGTVSQGDLAKEIDTDLYE